MTQAGRTVEDGGQLDFADTRTLAGPPLIVSIMWAATQNGENTTRY